MMEKNIDNLVDNFSNKSLWFLKEQLKYIYGPIKADNFLINPGMVLEKEKKFKSWD